MFTIPLTSSMMNAPLSMGTTTQKSVEAFLASLGLAEYLEIFLSEGFDTIESVEEINEDDLEHMAVKRGHRRVLQRALGKRTATEPPTPMSANASSVVGSVSQPAGYPSPVSGCAEVESGLCVDRCEHEHPECSSLSPASSPLAPLGQGLGQPSALSQTTILRPGCPTTSTMMINHSQQPQQHARQKRKYQRHPKPDLNAPEKPLSAYVMFSNSIREELKGKQVSFTEIARLVGERWKTLDRGRKESFERRAQEEKDRWSKLMATYKLTQEYEEYRQYLTRFKETQSHRAAATAGKTCPRGFVSASGQSGSGDPQGPVQPMDEGAGEEESEVEEDEWASRLPSPASPSEPGSVHGDRRKRPRSITPRPATRPPIRLSSCTYPRSPSEHSRAQPYRLPPPVTVSAAPYRPKIPSLSSLDEQLSLSQSLFFRRRRPALDHCQSNTLLSPSTYGE